MASDSRAVIWSTDAERDTDDIWNYLVSEATSAVADPALREIARVCRLLERHPFAGRPRDSLIPGMRSILAHPYVIFYRVTALNVEIVRVLHQRRDIEAIFEHDNDR